MDVRDHLQKIKKDFAELFDDGHVNTRLTIEAGDKLLASYEKFVTLFLVPREKSEV